MAATPQSDNGMHASSGSTTLDGLGKNLLGLALTRIELAALELGEVRDATLRLAVLALAGLMAAGFALALWVAVMVVLLWDAWGWRSLALAALLFSVGTAAIVCQVRREVSKGAFTLKMTLQELQQDRDALL